MFNFKSNCAVHESNTKYYQITSLVNKDNTKGCVITNWGKYTPGEVLGSKSKAHATKVDCYAGARALSTLSLHHAKKTVKAKNGYNFLLANTSDFIIPYNSELLELLEKLFKLNDVELIYKHLTDDSAIPSTFFSGYDAKALISSMSSLMVMRESPKMLDQKLNEENEKAANLRLAIQEKEARDFEKNELLQNLGWGLF